MSRHAATLPPLPPSLPPAEPVRWRPRTGPAGTLPNPARDAAEAGAADAAGDALDQRRRDAPARKRVGLLPSPADGAGPLTDGTLRALLALQEQGLDGLA